MEKPQKITDLVENIDLYIGKTRGIKPEETIAMTEFWENYARETIEGLKQSDIENKKLITEITDNLYRKAMNFEMIDMYTNGYIAIVLNRLFWELSQKGIHIFYVLDNSLRDDNLKLILEQFPPAGFAVITPHIGDKLEYKPETTQTENLPYEEVERKVKDALKLGKNIFYVERDASVTYLDKVLVLALNSGNEYAKVLRNKAPENPETMNIEEIELLAINK
jgi:hypothetical protein